MSCSAIAVANYFVAKGGEEGQPVDAMKLQKLLYFAHGWHLALFREPLLNERVEAWSYGPVVPSAYHEFKSNGQEPIEDLGLDWEWNGADMVRQAPQVGGSRITALLDKVREVYGGYSGLQLADMTHAKDGPWFAVWSGEAERGTIKNVDIDDSLIEAYFRGLAVANRGQV